MVKAVFPMDNFIVRSQFYDGSLKDFDIKPFFDNKPLWEGKPAFNMIKDNPKEFYKVHVIAKGFAIA